MSHFLILLPSALQPSVGFGFLNHITPGQHVTWHTTYTNKYEVNSTTWYKYFFAAGKAKPKYMEQPFVVPSLHMCFRLWQPII
jgi:hypothetical protein